jgi:hypothetical protein
MIAHANSRGKEFAASAPHRDRWRDRVALFVRCLRRGRLGEFLETRIAAERIEHWIEPEQRWIKPPKKPAYGIESSFCKAAMARSGSPMRAATRVR